MTSPEHAGFRAAPTMKAVASGAGRPGPSLQHNRPAVQRYIGNHGVLQPFESLGSEEVSRVHQAAQLGIGGAGSPLPYLEAIQRSFGNHDLLRIVAHTDDTAAQASRAMGAEAFTTGEHVAFAGRPSLHTAAHEAAHAIQQRAGVDLAYGIGADGDPHEQHADAVADLVVSGRSAEALLGRSALASTTDQVTATGVVGTQSVQRAPLPSTPATEPGPDPGFDQEKGIANSTYNKVVNAWGFLAQRQVLAIDSLYTEAKKPAKPSLAEELLGALAEAALAGALGGIGGLLAGAIERKVAAIFVDRALTAGAGRFRDAAGRFISNEAGKRLAIESAKNTAKFVAEFSKDAMKESVKSLAKPKIHALLMEGKAPIDGFFEGQKKTAVDAGKAGSDAAEDKRVTMMNDGNPMQAAQAEFEAFNDIYDAAEATQKEETLKSWLVYQAQVDAGVVDQGKRGAGTTNLSGETKPGWFSSYKAGVLYVVVGRDERIRDAHLSGSTANFVALLQDHPIMEMQIPVIVAFDFPGVSNFYINVNEKGFLWLEPSNGGQGNTYLRMHGGAQEGMGEENGQVYTSWTGGDPVTGARNLWTNVIGQQKVKGILEADK